MPRKNPPAKWVLPNTVDPPTSTCWMVPVPDDPFHRAAFLGALADLCAAYKWQDDTAHTAKQVARVWREIVDNLKECEVCDTPNMGVDEGDENMIRQNPDNPCELQSSVNGTDWCTFADFSLCIPDLTPSGTQPQPAPNGGCQSYKYNSTANQQWLLPYPVNSGDIITLTSASGAANDPFTTSGGLGVEWFCINGALYLAGQCLGLPQYAGSDPLPSQPHMSLIANVNGTWYPLVTSLTVPSGVTNGKVFFQLNGGVFYQFNGSSTFEVQVCNNSAGLWSSVLDYTTNPYVAFTTVTFGTWVSGQGYQTASGDGSFPNVVRLEHTLSSFNLTGAILAYNDVNGNSTGGNDNIELYSGPTPIIPATPAIHTLPASVNSGVVSVSGTNLEPTLNTGDAGGVGYLLRLTLTGSGTKPPELP